MRRLLPITAVLAAAGLLATVWFVGSSRSRETLGTVAGGVPYRWNEPFLDWPQSGDMVCDQEFGSCRPAAPSLDPERKALGTPLRIPAISVPVGKPGHHELELGQLVLVDGIHQRTYFKIANADVNKYRVAQTHVEFRSLIEGAPPFTEFAQDRPRVEGPEPVVAILVWDVDWAADGAEMEITDIEIE